MMDRWEYLIIRHGEVDPLADTMFWLNEWGDKGWELVQIGEPGFIFKRPMIRPDDAEES
jgi:hypothetical protein